MRILEKFLKPVVTAQPWDTLACLARLMAQHNVGAVVIVENSRPVGIVTDRDLALDLGARGMPTSTPAARVMTSPVTVISKDDGVFDITQALKDTTVRRLPIVDEEGLLVGLVTVDDVLRLLGRELLNMVDAIKPEMEIHGAP
jgi:signal-transduction protein with cAMP-binding, CBS, and nucleotidyltransferase domain